MQFEQLDGPAGSYMVRVESGEPLIETLTGFMQARGIGFAYVSAIGALGSVRLGWWNGSTREYEYHDVEEQMEVLSAQGNCSIMDGKPWLHLHCILGRHDLSVIGGHLAEGRVNPMLEVWVQSQEEPVRRASENGVNALQLGQHP